MLPPRDPAHDAQVRIFTVNREIPFAGHPNVGTAFVLATLAAKPPARLMFEEGAGLVPVEIADRAGQGGQHRIHRAAAAEADVASQRRTGGGLPLAVGGRHQDRPASAADHLGRPAVPRGRSRLARGAAAGAGPMPRRSRRPSRATAATRSTSIRAMCRPARSRCDLQARMFHPGAQRPVRRSRHRQRHGGRRGAAGRSRREQGRRTETEDRAGRRHGPAEPAADRVVQGRTARSFPCMSAAAACR